MNDNIENVSSSEESFNEDAEAAFAAFNSDHNEKIDVKAKDEKKEPEVKKEVATPEAPQQSEEHSKLLNVIADLERKLTQQVDRVSGNYGEIKRTIDNLQKKAQVPIEITNEPDDFDSEFPEIANGIQKKISNAMSRVPQGMDESQLESWYQQRKNNDEILRRSELIKTLDEAHPDRFEIQKLPEWNSWVNELQPHQKNALYNSEDPYYVSSMLSRFKTYRDNKVSSVKKNKQRIESAVTPSGARATTQSTVSEEEAAQKAFDDYFK